MRSVLPLEQAVPAHQKTAADEWHSFRHVRPNPYEVYTSLGSESDKLLARADMTEGADGK